MVNRLAALIAVLPLMEDRLIALIAALPLSENRLVALITALSVAVGLVFGGIAGSLWKGGNTLPDSVVRLDLPAQDDFIISVAEAYASDHDKSLAQDRLDRLHSQNTAARVEYLAIIEAGFLLQIDDPRMATHYNRAPNATVEECRKFIAVRVDATENFVPDKRLVQRCCSGSRAIINIYGDIDGRLPRHAVNVLQ